MYTITQIEDAIIDTLKNSALGAYCPRIESYQLEGGSVEEQIAQLVKKLPAALVVYSGGTFDVTEVIDRAMEFSILLVAASLRGKAQARRGEVGVYQMLEDCRTALTGSQCGLQIDELLPVKETAEENTNFFSAYSIDFRTSCRYTL